MIHTVVRLLGFGALVSFPAIASLSAQSSSTNRSNTRGLMVGAHLNGSALAYDGSNSESGGGIGLALGYGFSPKVQLYLNVDAANVDITDAQIGGSYSLGHGDLGIRYTFANSARAWVPYLTAAVTSRIASAEIDNSALSSTDVSISGPAVTGGGGLQYFFSEKLALDVGLLFSSGKFNTVKVGSISVDVDDVDNSSSTRFNIGLKFYPQVRR